MILLDRNFTVDDLRLGEKVARAPRGPIELSVAQSRDDAENGRSVSVLLERIPVLVRGRRIVLNEIPLGLDVHVVERLVVEPESGIEYRDEDGSGSPRRARTVESAFEERSGSDLFELATARPVTVGGRRSSRFPRRRNGRYPVGIDRRAAGGDAIDPPDGGHRRDGCDRRYAHVRAHRVEIPRRVADADDMGSDQIDGNPVDGDVAFVPRPRPAASTPRGLPLRDGPFRRRAPVAEEDPDRERLIRFRRLDPGEKSLRGNSIDGPPVDACGAGRARGSVRRDVRRGEKPAETERRESGGSHFFGGDAPIALIVSNAMKSA